MSKNMSIIKGNARYTTSLKDYKLTKIDKIVLQQPYAEWQKQRYPVQATYKKGGILI